MVLEAITTTRDHIARAGAGWTSFDACQYLEVWKYFAETVVPKAVDAIILASCRERARGAQDRAADPRRTYSVSGVIFEYIKRLRTKVKNALESSFALVMLRLREGCEFELASMLEWQSDEADALIMNSRLVSQRDTPRGEFFEVLVRIVQCKTVLVRLEYHAAVDAFVRPLLVHAIPFVRGVHEAILLQKSMQNAGVKREFFAKLNGTVQRGTAEAGRAEAILARAEMLLLALTS